MSSGGGVEVRNVILLIRVSALVIRHEDRLKVISESGSKLIWSGGLGTVRIL
jgi:hypothetical protein